MTARYLILFEKTQTGYSAYSPDLEGCVATGSDRSELETNMRAAVEMHLQSLKEDGYPPPPPLTESAYVEVAI